MIHHAAGAAPLGGIRVLDLGRYQAAPRCAAVLARLGADVIKVEPPGGDESRRMGPFVNGVSVYWAQHNAGKRSLAVDLRSDEGRRVVRRLVAVSDVLVENFRPGVIDRMGLSYRSLRELNPRLIVVHVSGFGRTGPLSGRLAFDQVGQAISGFMSLNGDPAGEPTISPFPMVDRLTALHAVVAVLAALHERTSSGLGQEIDVTLADAAYSTVEVPLATYLAGGGAPGRTGNATSLGNMYPTRDGHVYVVDYGGDHIFPRLAAALGQDAWNDDARLIDREGRVAQSGVIEAQLVAWCGRRTSSAVVDALTRAGVPCAAVNDIPAAAAEAYFVETRPYAEADDGAGGNVRVPGPYMAFGRSQTAVGPVPGIGQHSSEILAGVLGMSPIEVESLRRAGVVAGP